MILENRKFLIPTAEVVLTNIVNKTTLEEKGPPLDMLHQLHVLEKGWKLWKGHKRSYKATSVLQS